MPTYSGAFNFYEIPGDMVPGLYRSSGYLDTPDSAHWILYGDTNPFDDLLSINDIFFIEITQRHWAFYTSGFEDWELVRPAPRGFYVKTPDGWRNLSRFGGNFRTEAPNLTIEDRFQNIWWKASIDLRAAIIDFGIKMPDGYWHSPFRLEPGFVVNSVSMPEEEDKFPISRNNLGSSAWEEKLEAIKGIFTDSWWDDFDSLWPDGSGLGFAEGPVPAEGLSVRSQWDKVGTSEHRVNQRFFVSLDLIYARWILDQLCPDGTSVFFEFTSQAHQAGVSTSEPGLTTFTYLTDRYLRISTSNIPIETLYDAPYIGLSNGIRYQQPNGRGSVEGSFDSILLSSADPDVIYTHRYSLDISSGDSVGFLFDCDVVAADDVPSVSVDGSAQAAIGAVLDNFRFIFVWPPNGGGP